MMERRVNFSEELSPQEVSWWDGFGLQRILRKAVVGQFPSAPSSSRNRPQGPMEVSTSQVLDG
jgi:hypothetical protein